ncbi:prepilin-type N-terminal cleavage/methylation domain-containing protein [Deferribacter autotrophicus]|uniref:Prepilin-type N-terminal cleavage/methylation domain-containing protein n=1 Tax=Deferribacter autotrophicus TaxID=500465 RepID=A0A5A8F5L5_9BACT|nr:PilW family protein [Deferribacter autotrophicus]KAA0259347.1 prepilin-type N-terminal cleavage/methylation domain-containing protein [Deferribacter autotrophicus]
MNKSGYSLIEFLITIFLFGIIGSIVFAFYINFQNKSINEITNSDLYERANRIMLYLTKEIRTAGFMVSSIPKYSDNSKLIIEGKTYDYSIVPENFSGNNGSDNITIVKAVSNLPEIHVVQNYKSNSNIILVDNDFGNFFKIDSSKNHLIFENHKVVYKITNITGKTITLQRLLKEKVPKNTAVLGVRALKFYVDDGALKLNDFNEISIIDDSIDGLQFQYILEDGSIVNNPSGSTIEKIRAIKVFLLVRAQRIYKNYKDSKSYILADTVYGPFNDSYKRVYLENVIEVKNYAYE